jgi:HAD superfamily hydrolase (TIGR01509 family)
LSTSFDLVIFDCDGVLVDSERVANEVFARVLDEVCGLTFTLDDMFDTFVGHSRLQCLQKIEALIGEPPPPELDLRYQRDINDALEKTVQAIDGIDKVLDALSLPYCVASSGSHEKMRMTLGKTGLMRFFDGNIYSTSDVERGKPHPDIYLHAARSMGVTRHRRGRGRHARLRFRRTDAGPPPAGQRRPPRLQTHARSPRPHHHPQLTSSRRKPGSRFTRIHSTALDSGLRRNDGVQGIL